VSLGPLMDDGRADFTEATRRALAQRAAYRCSNPGCRALTVGPGPGAGDVVRTGRASHIFAAAEKGPRGTGGLQFDERRQIENGIWLCANCDALVDATRGSAHPPALLRSWKDLHEALVRTEQGEYSRPIGWVSSIELLKDPLLVTPSEVRLARKNVICGNNGSGKTTILELLHGVTSTRQITKRLQGAGEVSVRIKWFDPHPRTATIDAGNGYAVNDAAARRVLQRLVGVAYGL
jgi:hypothetical protein